MEADPVKRPPTAQPTATPPSLPSLLMRLGRHLLALIPMLTSGLLEMLSVGAVPTLLLGLLAFTTQRLRPLSLLILDEATAGLTIPAAL